MSKSKVDKHNSGKRNKLQDDTRQQQPHNLGQPKPRDFAKQLSQQLNALEQTFNEAREANHPFQNRNGSGDEELKEISLRSDYASDDADENGDKETNSRTHDCKVLEGQFTKGKRTSSNASDDNQSQDGAQAKRSRTLPSSIS